MSPFNRRGAWFWGQLFLSLTNFESNGLRVGRGRNALEKEKFLQQGTFSRKWDMTLSLGEGETSSRPFPAVPLGLFEGCQSTVPAKAVQPGLWSVRTSRLSRSSLAFLIKNTNFIFKNSFPWSTNLTSFTTSKMEKRKNSKVSNPGHPYFSS